MRGRAYLYASVAAALRLALEWPLLRRGVYAISDDDFARVTIAQRWVVTPAADPSGTSWLPAHFWLLGMGGKLLGRSWESMQLASLLLSAGAAAYLAFVLARQLPRGPAALAAIAAALLNAWSVWCGACTVPEAYTGLLSAAALVALAAPRYPWHAALALGAAALSRYEVWPVVLVVAGLGTRWKRGTWAFAPVLAPLAWIGWNAHAHGDAFHFLARVAKYRAVHASAQATAGLHFPAVALEGMRWLLPALPALLLPQRFTSLAFRQLRLALLAGALGTVLFLAYGDARGGAPTHHAERALVGVWAMSVVLVAIAAGQSHARGPSGLVWTTRVAGLALLMQVGSECHRLLCTPPPGEPRAEAFARGRALAAEPHLLLRPCAYEHYALAAGYGAPERVRILPAQTETPPCPDIVQGEGGAPLR